MIQSWKLGLAWLVMSGAIASLSFANAFWANCAYAQITPDATLPNNSRVTTQGNIKTIEGGTQAGSNLFHSFQEFTVPTSGTAFFNNAADIQNIISRVTGGSVSNIDGLIRTNGNANLFLINPNGIIFGANASLNIGGSFVASTANALQFANLGFFSATDKNSPSPLLTINPSALLFNQINPNAAIQNNSIAPVGKDPAGFNASGLRVPNGKNLLLVGGNISMDGGRLNANGGRVELGGLDELGTVLLDIDGDNLSLIFPENVARADISLTNSSGIYVAGAGGGNIAVNAKNLEILGGSILNAGIGRGLGTPETVAGDIKLDATGEIKVAGTGSNVRNLVQLRSRGNGGNITIDSGSFSLQDGARLSASSRGQGNAGNVTVRVLDAVELADSEILSRVEAGGVGNSGNIDINAGSLSLIDIANLQTDTRSASTNQPAEHGNAGNVNLNITGAINIAGSRNRNRSGIFSRVQTGAIGNAGKITINAGSFSLRDGAQVTASTRGRGNAGNVTVKVKDAVELAGSQTNISSTVLSGGVGKGGDIDIEAATLSLADGANLQTDTRSASTNQPAEQGNAGNVNLNITGAINIAGIRGTSSGIFSRVQTGAVGNGGNITINSGSLSLSDRAQLSASTSGQGNAGNVTVRAKDTINLAGEETKISSTVSGGVGKGGNIDINAATLSLTNGAQLLTLTSEASGNQPAGRGDAGNVNVKVTGAIDIAGKRDTNPSGIFSRVETGTVGNGGNITIDSGSFSLSDRAQLSASTSGQGNAGTIKVNATNFVNVSGKSSNSNSNLFVNSQSTTGTAGDIIVTSPKITLDNGGRLNAESASGNGGNINLQTDLLLLRRSAQISTTARRGGNGGNINIDAPSGFIVAKPRENNDIIANAFSGSGGRVTINAAGIFGIAPLSRQDLERLRPDDLDSSKLPTNDITAISQTNPALSGQINLNIPNIDPNSGLINLPTVPVDPEVVQACTPGNSQANSEFVVTGRGGLPPNPTEALNTDAIAVDWVTLRSQSKNKYNTANSTILTMLESKLIVEAQGWLIDRNGKVVLTAFVPTATTHNAWQTLANCSS